MSTVFCISPTIRFKSSPFSNTFAISFVICRIPPPRAPIISGTTTISYPCLLFLSSNASCRYFVSFPIFWCRYYVVADTPYHKSRFSSSPYPRVSGPVSSLSSSFVDGIRNPTPAFLYCSLSPFLSPTIPCTISHLHRPVRILDFVISLLKIIKGGCQISVVLFNFFHNTSIDDKLVYGTQHTFYCS